MFTRRSALVVLSGAAALPSLGRAATARVVSWEDLIPKGVPYGAIIGQGDLNMATDQWAPIFDENASKLNEKLNGVLVKIPGFIIPMTQSARGVTEFMLVPYVGACIHTPPPPPNQLVLVNAKKPWPSDSLWDPVWVVGIMRTKLQKTDLGQTGYTMQAEKMEIYEW